jgi:3-oxoadipate enol-lactonase
VAVFEGGEGPAVLLVHGYCGSHDDWADVAARLIDAGRHVVTLDLPGHGASGLIRPVVTVDDIATVVEQVLVTLDLRDVALVGHSLGSMGVLRLAETGREPYRERVGALGLISCSPSPWRPPEVATVLTAAIRSLDPSYTAGHWVTLRSAPPPSRRTPTR